MRLSSATTIAPDRVATATLQVETPGEGFCEITGEVRRHFRDQCWAVRVPRRVQEAGLRVSRASTELYQTLGRSPTVEETPEPVP